MLRLFMLVMIPDFSSPDAEFDARRRQLSHKKIPYMFIPYVICPVRFINDKRAAKIQQSGAKIRTGTVPHIFNGTYSM